MPEIVDEDAELARIEAEIADPSKAVVAEPPTPEAPETPETPETPAPEVPATPETPDDDIAAEHAPKRVRIETLPEAERYKIASATNLAKSEGISFSDAWARVNPTAAAPVTPEPTPDPVDALTAELAEVQATLDAAAEDQSLFTPELAKAIDRKAELRDAIRDANNQKANAEAAQVQTAQQTWDADWKTSEAWVAERYPDALVADSPLNKAVVADVEAIAADPKHPLYGNPNLPKLLFAQHAADLGIAPKAKAAAPAPAPSRMLPASGGAKTSPAPVVNPATQQAEFQARQAKAADEGDADELYMLAEEELTGKRPERRAMLTIR